MKKANFYKKGHSPVLNQGTKSTIYLGDFEQRFLSRLILSFFRRDDIWRMETIIVLFSYDKVFTVQTPCKHRANGAAKKDVSVSKIWSLYFASSLLLLKTRFLHRCFLKFSSCNFLKNGTPSCQCYQLFKPATGLFLQILENF